jgi:hypothetical protein
MCAFIACIKIFYFAYITNPADYAYKSNVDLRDFFVGCIIYPFLLAFTNAYYLKISGLLANKVSKDIFISIFLVISIVIWFFVGAFINYYISHIWLIATMDISQILLSNRYGMLHPYLEQDWSKMLLTEGVLLMLSNAFMLSTSKK